MNASRRSLYEVIIVVIVVALTVVLTIGLYVERTKVHKGRMLTTELSSLRTSVTLYTVVNRKPPHSIAALLDETYEARDGSRRVFAEYAHRDGSGSIIDPFGMPYAYDPESGWISSSTAGYQTW